MLIHLFCNAPSFILEHFRKHLILIISDILALHKDNVLLDLLDPMYATMVLVENLVSESVLNLLLV